LAYIGNKPANKAVVASDLDPAVITGQTALAVAPADTDEFLISDAGTLKRIDASLVGGGGITEADMYRLTADSNDSNVLPLTNWERVDDATFSKLGTGISVSSGIFSFPSTGLYLIRGNFLTRVNTGDNAPLTLQGSNDNFSSNDDILARQEYGVVSSGNPYMTKILETYFNCTNVSTHKVKVNFYANSSMDIYGDTNQNESTMTFIRLGDSQ